MNPLPSRNQRWHGRRDSYRPAAEPIRTADYTVAELPDDTTARAFVLEHHYSNSYPSARFRFGLYGPLGLEGVAVFSHPMNDAVLTNVFPGPARDSVELGRFVLLDSVAGNGETWLLARCFEQLRARGLRGVVSFSDPVPRISEDGQRYFGGHVGTIYQAFNGVYLGRATPRSQRVLPDGSTFSARAIQKLLSREKGWRYPARLLVAAGAELGVSVPMLTPTECPERWLREWRPRVTRSVRHPGNHKYAWELPRRRTFALAAAGAYPKQPDPFRPPAGGRTQLTLAALL